MKILKKSSGFTLVEIVVVIGIMGILSAIVYGSFNSARAQSRDQRKISDMAGIQLALETYYNRNNQYPMNLTDLTDPTVVPKYISNIPTPPTAGDSYNYFPMRYGNSGPCISYQLWVKLELGNSVTSSSKRGFNSLGNGPFANKMYQCGEGHNPIDASSNRLIYDMVQQ